MKKIAYGVGIIICVFALVLVSLVIFVKKKESDCRSGKGVDPTDAAESCNFIIAHVPVKTLKWSYRYSKAEHYYDAGMKKEALAELDDMLGIYESGQVPVVSGKTVVHVYALAAFYNFKAGEISKAGKYADIAIQKGSEKKEMFAIRAASLLNDGKYQEALDDLGKAGSAGFSPLGFYYHQGEAYRGAGDYEKAYASFKAAEPLITEPARLAKLNRDLGLVCYSLKRYDEALTRLKNAEAAGENCAECAAAIAEIQKEQAPPPDPLGKNGNNFPKRNQIAFSGGVATGLVRGGIRSATWSSIGDKMDEPVPR